MCTKDTLNELLQKFKSEAEKVFGSKLQDMILYGSYARGDNTDESDIDVIRVCGKSCIKQYLAKLNKAKITGISLIKCVNNSYWRLAIDRIWQY